MNKSYPVRYMVVPMWPISHFYARYKIIDTSFAGQGRTVKRWLDCNTAHDVARIMNNLEGFQYAW